MPPLTPRHGRRSGALAGLAVVLSTLAAACDYEVPSAAYVAPAPGTVYDYGTFTNTVTASDGWRTTYVDDAGRTGRRVAVFITEDPARPLEIAPAALDSLWPLRLGSKVTLRSRQDEEVYRWEFQVRDTATVTVGAGTFHTLVVQGLHTPELVRDPNRASTVLHTWWYAPQANAVVRFESNYLGGPGTGRRFEGELREVRAAGAAGATAPDSAAGPPPDPAAGRAPDTAARTGGARPPAP